MFSPPNSSNNGLQRLPLHVVAQDFDEDPDATVPPSGASAPLTQADNYARALDQGAQEASVAWRVAPSVRDFTQGSFQTTRSRYPGRQVFSQPTPPNTYRMESLSEGRVENHRPNSVQPLVNDHHSLASRGDRSRSDRSRSERSKEDSTAAAALGVAVGAAGYEAGYQGVDAAFALRAANAGSPSNNAPETVQHGPWVNHASLSAGHGQSYGPAALANHDIEGGQGGHNVNSVASNAGRHSGRVCSTKAVLISALVGLIILGAAGGGVAAYLKNKGGNSQPQTVVQTSFVPTVISTFTPTVVTSMSSGVPVAITTSSPNAITTTVPQVFTSTVTPTSTVQPSTQSQPTTQPTSQPTTQPTTQQQSSTPVTTPNPVTVTVTETVMVTVTAPAVTVTETVNQEETVTDTTTVPVTATVCSQGGAAGNSPTTTPPAANPPSTIIPREALVDRAAAPTEQVTLTSTVAGTTFTATKTLAGTTTVWDTVTATVATVTSGVCNG